MAFAAFLKIGDGTRIRGESTHPDHPGEIEIASFSFGANHPGSIRSAAAGPGAGKVSISSFSVVKKTDTASPLLFQMCCAGEHVPTVLVTLRTAGPEAREYLTYEFSDVYVDSIRWSGSAGGDDAPTEALSLSFAAVHIRYRPRTGGPAVEGGWDATTNQAK